MVAGCKGRVSAAISEAQANDTLRYLQGLFNTDKYLHELKLKRKSKKTDTEIAVPHRAMLDEVMGYIDNMLERSKYNKVDLSQIFQFMVKA